METSNWSGITGYAWPRYRGNHRCDVAIVGGGLTGVTLAYRLAESGVSVTLLEAETLGFGASSACTGKVTAYQAEACRQAASVRGEVVAAIYAECMMNAIRDVCALAEKLHQSVDHNTLSAIALQESDLPRMDKGAHLLRRLGVPVTQSDDSGDCPVPLLGAWEVHEQALLTPLSYLHAMAEAAAALGAQLFEHSRVTFTDDSRVFTDNGVLEARYIVLATGTPLNLTSLPRLSMLTQRSACLYKLCGLPRFFGSYVQAAENALTFRPIPEGALVVKTLGVAGTLAARRRLTAGAQELAAYLPDAAILGTFACQDVDSADGMPLIGPIHRQNSCVLMATGYGGWGLTGSMLASKLLTGYILGDSPAYVPHFLPFRSFRGKAGLLVQQGARPMAALVGNSFRLTAPRCSHMGCRLRFSHASGLWECPCHGSAFTILGECVHAPAVEPIEVSILQRPRP